MLVSSRRLPRGARMTRDGMRYSNIDPDHDRSAAPKPVPARNIVLGDCEKTREARLGRQQVVATWIERALRYAIADREQPTLRIEEKSEVHSIGRRQSRRCECNQARLECDP